MNAPLRPTPAPGGLDIEIVTVSLGGFLSTVDDAGLKLLDRSDATAPEVLSSIIREAVRRERERRSRLLSPKPKRTLQDALNDAQAAIQERRAKDFRDARLPYPKDEEIDRG